jgi:hypothetical protein
METKSPACRMDDETKNECVSRKIPEIMKDDPDMEQDQAIAIAESMCSKKCKEAGMEVKTREVGEKVHIKGIFEKDTVKSLGNGVFEAIINTGEVDRQGERVNIDGVDLRAWKQNPVVLYGHDYYSLPIGKGLSIGKRDEKISSKFQLATEEYDFAGTVAKLIEGGYLNAVSIGLLVKEWSPDYTEIVKSEMVEYSIVPVPSDKGSLIQRSLGKTEDQFRAEYKDFLVKSLAEKSSKDELENYITNLRNLVALLEDTHKVSQNEAATEKVRRIHKITLTKAAGQLVKEAERTVHILKISLK